MGDDGLFFIQDRSQTVEGLLEHLVDIDALAFDRVSALARIGQQVIDERLHAHGALDDKGDKPVCIGIETALIALLQKRCKAANGA